MMKKYLIISGFLFLSICSYSQITMRGIVEKKFGDYNEGDTIALYGFKQPEGTTISKYLVFSLGVTTFVPEKKIVVLPNQVSFWDSVWFYNKGADITKNGWQADRRKTLSDDAFEYLNQAISNNMIYEDEFLYDYFYQLILKIHPTPLIKNEPENLKLLIIKSKDQEYFAFDNGTIVLTTGLIANSNSEDEIVRILAECVSHVVFEHNLSNLNMMLRTERNAEIWGAVATIASSALMVNSNIQHGSYFSSGDALIVGLGSYFISHSIMQSVGADYSSEQIINAQRTANYYLKNSNWSYLSKEDYIKRVSGIISYSAKQEYHLMNYAYGLELTNKLYDLGVCTEADLLLKARFHRSLENSKESNEFALTLIENAFELGLSNLIDLHKEAGMIYLRLDDPVKAKESFLKYQEGLVQLEEKGADVGDEIDKINEVFFKYGL
ncbi:MAG: M48 family metalloprotease [Salinivirgaceae bacterium]|nr:M48 family metalloprotease [Salinivirgaceae bacterium]